MIRTFILAVQTAPANNMEMSLWDMVVKGGWLMIPIFILSVIIIYIACERFWLIRKTGLSDVPFMERIQEILKTGNTRAALEECEKEASPLANTLAKGIKRTKNRVRSGKPWKTRPTTKSPISKKVSPPWQPARVQLP